MNPQRKYPAAALQFEPYHGEKYQNCTRLEKLVRQAADDGAKLVVMPEMATIGLFWRDRAHIAPFVETIPGPTTKLFAQLARALEIYIVVGMGEVDPATDIYYNSAALVGPDGVVGVHRKIHGYLSDPLWAADGDLGFQTWETPLGRLGMLICMDANYPESGRLLALNGADVLLMPVAWVDEVCPAPLWIMRAFDNSTSAICANRWGREMDAHFSGGSAILNPDGSIFACVSNNGRDEIVLGDIDLDDTRRNISGDTTTFLNSRRPELYDALVLNRYLWDTSLMQARYASPLPEGKPFQAVVLEWEQVLPLQQRLTAMETIITETPHNTPNLLVLPELSFSGQPRDRQHALELAEPIDGNCIVSLINCCASHNSYVVVGFVECEGATLYNTLALVGPEGVCGHYRKTHLSTHDQTWATPDDCLRWADTPIGRIGLLFGTDLTFAEPARCLAILGCDLICVSAALAAPQPIYRRTFDSTAGDELHWHFARTRAGENDVYIVFANWRGGKTDDNFMGHSGIFFGPSLFAAPLHESLIRNIEGQECGYATTLIDAHTNPQSALRTKPGIKRRLPGQYARLLYRQNLQPATSGNDH